MGTDTERHKKDQAEKLKAIRAWSYEQSKKFYEAILRFENGDTDRALLQKRDLVFLNELDGLISFISKGAAEYHTNEFLDSTKDKTLWDKSDQIRMRNIFARKAPRFKEAHMASMIVNCLFAPFSTCLYVKYGNYIAEIVVEDHMTGLLKKFAKQNDRYIEITEQDMFQDSHGPLASGYNVLNLRRTQKK